MENQLERARRACASALLALVLPAAPAALFAQTDARTVADNERIAAGTGSSVQTTIQPWPERSRDIARAMIEKYGEPAIFNDNGLLWNDKGPWKKIVVYRSALPHYAWIRDKDYLKQAIAYKVPADKVEALKRFDSRIKIDEPAGELSSRSESESLNFLALNLAVEIVNGRRSVENARDVYRNTKELAKSGKSSSYLERLLY